MSLMSGLFLGATGLQTSQNSLHTTAHNLSNIETPGYVRQQTLHADMSYNTISTSPAVSKMQIGLGVEWIAFEVWQLVKCQYALACIDLLPLVDLCVLV